MRLIDYLKDKKFFILFYIILMNVITTIVYFDYRVKMDFEDVLYLNLVSFALFLMYLFGGYIYYNRYFKDIKILSESKLGNTVESLPKPQTKKQELYHEVFLKINRENSEVLNKLLNDKKENLDYTTRWVHEIKTPIATSHLMIDNFYKNNMTDCDKLLRSLELEISKIESYVDQSLYYSRVDSFSRDYIIKECDITQIIKDVIKKNSNTFIAKSISINLEEFELSVVTDKKWFEFIVNQIIINALKYTGKQGKIKIYTESGESGTTLHIEDNGQGIKDEDIRRVFDKGFTGGTGREKTTSTGMGLYLAKQLSDKLDHKISISSEEGKYTRVSIFFPKLAIR